MSTWLWITITCVVALLSVIAVSLYYRKKTTVKVKYMFDAFEDGELNFHFKDSNEFNRTLNRLRGIYEKRRIANEQDSWTKLIRVLTHEIMNTLSPIVSLSEALCKNAEEESRENIKEGLEIISDSSRNLVEFISTYRQITGLAKPVRKQIDLKGIIEKLVKLNSEIFAQHNISVVLQLPEKPMEIFGDEIQINQVIQNLLKNAIEAASTEIKVVLKRLSDGSVLLWVINNGKPISPELKDHIFIPFYTTKSTGSGIGLSVCRQILRYHNGSIGLLRSNSEETVFEILLN